MILIKGKIKIRVSYADTDQMGVVYYARYLEYFERGRNELFRELGLPYRELENRGIMLPVIEAHCEYKRGARYDEVIIVKTLLKEPQGVRIRMDYAILDEKEKEIIAKGYTIHSFVNTQGKAIKPPKDFIKLIQDKL